ncbi:MAG TPA: hypothetical protein VGP89_13190, partial [Candidatus Angelobacter sp.]|nr:hypothetical protein [Candidatus Angelobacter sp.]
MHIQDAIDAKIRKLQMLKELASDPEALAFMRQLVMESSNGTHTPKPPTATPWPPPLVVKQPPVRPRSSEYGQQQRLVEEVLRTSTEPVSIDWIVSKMRERGYTFMAKKPNVAVNECLRQAAENGRAKVARKEGILNY